MGISLMSLASSVWSCISPRGHRLAAARTTTATRLRDIPQYLAGLAIPPAAGLLILQSQGGRIIPLMATLPPFSVGRTTRQLVMISTFPDPARRDDPQCLAEGWRQDSNLHPSSWELDA